MAEFGFGFSNVQATSSAMRRLAPWGIYSVTFKGCRKESIQGKKDPTQSYDILKVRFEGEDGYYEESIFFPKERDNVRPEYTSKDGHKYEGASSFERTMTFVAQLIQVICGLESFEKFRALSTKFTSFNDVCTALIKLTDPKIDKVKTNLKLVGRTKDNTVEPCLPKFVAVNKSGDVFTCDNFIGEKLFFSSYEEGKKREYESAKPTDMSKVENDPLTQTSEPQSDNSDIDNIDFNSLL